MNWGLCGKYALALSILLLVVLLLTPSYATETVDIPYDGLAGPASLLADSSVRPLAIPTSYSYYVDAKAGTNNIPNSSLTPTSRGSVPSWSYMEIRAKGSDYLTRATYYSNAFFGVGISVNAPKNTVINVSWSGFVANSALTYSQSKTDPNPGGLSILDYPARNDQYTSRSWYLFDQNFNILAGPFSSNGSTSVVSNGSITNIIFGMYEPLTYKSTGYGYAYYFFSFPLSTANLSYSLVVPETEVDILKQTNALLSQGNSSLSHIDSDAHQMIVLLSDLQSSVSTPSAMEQFEQRYLEKMEGQLSQVEDMMSPDNPALPNGGDIAGFASDIQNGLGFSGSAFNASEFSDALSAFSGAEATAAGGPWEFFTQAVADSLSGDTQTASLNDDDYIYAWLEMMQGRYSSWSSSSP